MKQNLKSVALGLVLGAAGATGVTSALRPSTPTERLPVRGTFKTEWGNEWYELRLDEKGKPVWGIRADGQHVNFRR